MKIRIWPCLILGFGILTSDVVPRAAANVLVGVTFSGANSVLYSLNPATGAASDPRTTGTNHLVGIAYSSGGTLYGLTNSTASSNPNSLLTVNAQTGATQVVGSTGLSGVVEGDLGFDSTSGTLYGMYELQAGQRKLFTMNTATGAATLLPNSLAGDPSAMAFDVSGTLFVVDTSLQLLSTVNKTTGATLSSIALSTALGAAAGMAFDPTSGLLYVTDGESGGTNRLYTLNTTNGVLTDIGASGVTNGLSGLAFIPEPTTALLLATGMVLGIRSQRPRRH